MNRSLIYLLILLLAAGGLGTLVAIDPGYVLISYNGVSLQTSLWFFGLMIVVLFLVGYFVIRFLRTIGATNLLISSWRSNKKTGKSRRHTQEGIVNLLKGHWQSARRYLLLGSNDPSSSFSNYLGAAYAAAMQGDQGLAYDYVAMGKEIDATAGDALDIYLARLELYMGEQAKAIQRLSPRSQYPAARDLLITALDESENYEAIWTLIQQQRKSWETADYLELSHKYAIRLMAQWLESGSYDTARMSEVWKSLGNEHKKDPRLVELYARSLNEAGDSAAAESLLKKQINRNIDESLVECYGVIKLQPMQIKTAGNWLDKNPDNPALLRCLGRLYKQDNALQKAREMMEKSLVLEQSLTTQIELAGILDRLGEMSRSQQLLVDAARKRGLI